MREVYLKVILPSALVIGAAIAWFMVPSQPDASDAPARDSAVTSVTDQNGKPEPQAKSTDNSAVQDSAQDKAQAQKANVTKAPGDKLEIADAKPEEPEAAKQDKAAKDDELDLDDTDAVEKAIGKAYDYGKTQPVPADANEQVKSVAAALRSKNQPERLSPMIQPKPFDKEAYLADPDKYINTIEPGRVFQTTDPAPGVKRLKRLSDKHTQIIQGQSTTLSVETEPGMPVTFTSFDLGQFENKLTSITVKADDTGKAQTTFTGSSGTINDVKILASSPVTSGQVRFVVNIDYTAEAKARQAALDEQLKRQK